MKVVTIVVMMIGDGHDSGDRVDGFVYSVMVVW